MEQKDVKQKEDSIPWFKGMMIVLLTVLGVGPILNIFRVPGFYEINPTKRIQNFITSS